MRILNSKCDSTACDAEKGSYHLENPHRDPLPEHCRDGEERAVHKSRDRKDRRGEREGPIAMGLPYGRCRHTDHSW
jgi:hypothetical protein